MIVWRVSNYASLEGLGGLKASGRWHTRGRPVVYCATNPAAALLEILVHLEIDVEDVPATYKFLMISGPDDPWLSQHVDREALPAGWEDDGALTRSIGDSWLKSTESALLWVPSKIVPSTYNVLLNPLHPDSRAFRIASVTDHPFDRRLVKAPRR
jgi:RES domain-containing protein